MPDKERKLKLEKRNEKRNKKEKQKRETNRGEYSNGKDIIHVL